MNVGDDLMTYNDLINIYNARYYDINNLWAYEKIIEHSKALGGKHELQVMWDKGKTTWEPMNTLN